MEGVDTRPRDDSARILLAVSVFRGPNLIWLKLHMHRSWRFHLNKPLLILFSAESKQFKTTTYFIWIYTLNNGSS